MSNFHNSVGGALEFLHTLPELKGLDFSDSAISDFAIDILASLPHLEVLDLRGTGLSKEGIDRLRHEMPHCVIRADDTPDYIIEQEGSK